jgi:hypothetical protein
MIRKSLERVAVGAHNDPRRDLNDGKYFVRASRLRAPSTSSPIQR